nr:MAG TPA: protein of unknown function (DUF4969) [Caudoviricetes sp.]
MSQTTNNIINFLGRVIMTFCLATLSLILMLGSCSGPF